MGKQFEIIEIDDATQGVELALPAEWQAPASIVVDATTNTLLLADMITNGVRKACPRVESCQVNGYREVKDGRLVLAAASCSVERCPVGP